MRKVFGKVLRSLRTKRGLSQEELAARVGLTMQAISAFERHLALPTLESLVDIARELGVSVSVLIEPEPTDEVQALLRRATNALTSLPAEDARLIVEMMDALATARRAGTKRGHLPHGSGSGQKAK